MAGSGCKDGHSTSSEGCGTASTHTVMHALCTRLPDWHSPANPQRPSKNHRGHTSNGSHPNQTSGPMGSISLYHSMVSTIYFDLHWKWVGIHFPNPNPSKTRVYIRIHLHGQAAHHSRTNTNCNGTAAEQQLVNCTHVTFNGYSVCIWYGWCKDDFWPKDLGAVHIHNYMAQFAP